MTAYGPPNQPGPPPGPPSGPPPGPPSGGYGPPAAPAGAPGGRAIAAAVSPLDWAALGAALIALVFSFFDFYTYNVNLKELAAETHAPLAALQRVCKDPSQVPAGERASVDRVCNGLTVSAWHGFFGWFAVILAVIAAVVLLVALFAPQTSMPIPPRLAAAGLWVLAFICALIALFVIPSAQNGATVPGVSYDKIVDEGHGFSYWVVLIVLLVGAALSLLRFQQTGGALPGSSRTSAGGFGAGAPAGPTGYGQPQQPYSAPAPPQQYPPQAPPQQYPPQGGAPAQGPQYGAPQETQPETQPETRPETPPGYGPQQPGYGQQPPGYGQQPPPPGYQPPPQQP